MAFDASPREVNHEPQRAPAFRHEPIDWLDWLSRIAMFGALGSLYAYWVFTILRAGVRALLG
jgi:hypothetical protein